MTEPPETNEPTELPVADPDAELPAPGEPPERISLAVRLATLVAIIVPLLGLVAAPFFLWGWGFRWIDLGLLAGHVRPDRPWASPSASTGCSSTARSRRTSWVKFVLAVLGSMAVQGPLLKWVAMHRRHHQHSDTPDDPHSPAPPRRGRPRRAARLLARPHRLVLRPRPAGPRPLRQGPQPAAVRCGWRAPCSPLWVALGLLIPAVLGGLLTGTLGGRLDGADLGRAGPHLPGPPRDLERQLGLPPVGPAALPERRREPEQRRVRRPGAGRGVAQHPPRLPDLGPARPAVVADRRRATGSSARWPCWASPGT